MSMVESDVEQAALDWFEQIGYTPLRGPDVSPGGTYADREAYSEVILSGRLYTAIRYLNPQLSPEAVEEVYRRVTRIDHPILLERNRIFHQLLTEGVTVENRRSDGTTRNELARLIHFTQFDKNDWLIVNQFTVIDQGERRPDLVVFVNGLPLVVIELKSPADEKATLNGAFQQLQTYKAEIPSLLTYNEILVVSDGVEARAGTLTSNWERFQPWRTIDGTTIAPRGVSELETLLRGIFSPERFLDLLYSFIVFESDGVNIDKKMAAYHQYHAVNKAVATTVAASALDGDQRAGVIWHTQGSGKSLTMLFYAGKIIQKAEMENPTIVVLTDRNDLDEQLFGTFSRCQEILRQEPLRAEERADLALLLKNRASGGVIFTTIQKFLPPEGVAYETLSDRHNIIFIADEAHRSQYGLNMHLVKGKEADDEEHIAYGFAKYLRDALPNASYIGFTGTPIAKADRNTRAIFGEYIDVYDIHRSVEDGATVRIYYEARTIPLKLDEGERPQINLRFDEVTEGSEPDEKEKLKTKWGRLEALVGADERIEKIAADIIKHFEQRQEVLEGKAMIVCMSRRICVALYQEIVKLRPEWHHGDDDKGAIKVVMTGSAKDGASWQQHIRTKKGNEVIANRIKDTADPLKMVLVCDMWLTGFDVPCLHTMYLDKSMQGHGLMQAIARVNRVFKDKEGGLIVDYLGLADDLKRALHDYSQADQAEAGIDQGQAVAKMQEKYEIVRALFYGFDYSQFFSERATVRLSVIPNAMEHILKQQDGKNRYVRAVAALSKAYALAVPQAEALKLREEIAFFQVVRTSFLKSTRSRGRAQADIDTAMRQIVSQAVAADGAIDLYATLGVKNPYIDLFSAEFLDKMRNLPQQHLAFEVLNKLIDDQIKTQFSKNIVKAQTFEAKLEKAVKLYQERAIEAALTMLRANAEEIRNTVIEDRRLGLDEDALAFYDALKAGNSNIQEMEDIKLRQIAEELVMVVKSNVSPDWTFRQSTRSNISRTIRRFLRQNGYPLEPQQRDVVELIVKQAEALSQDWNIA